MLCFAWADKTEIATVSIQITTKHQAEMRFWRYAEKHGLDGARVVFMHKESDYWLVQTSNPSEIYRVYQDGRVMTQHEAHLANSATS